MTPEHQALLAEAVAAQLGGRLRYETHGLLRAVVVVDGLWALSDAELRVLLRGDTRTWAGMARAPSDDRTVVERLAGQPVPPHMQTYEP